MAESQRDLIDLAHHVKGPSLSPVEDEEALCQYLERRLHELFEERRPWDFVWNEITRLVIPERLYLHAYYSSQVTGDQFSPIEYLRSIASDIHNTDAPEAIHLLTAGIQGYALTRTSPWFAHTLPRERLLQLPGVMEFLADGDEQLRSALGTSNFYAESGPVTMDVAAYGNACCYMEPSDQGYSFQAIDPREVFVAEDAQRNIDTVYRVFSMTKRQCIERFGYDRISDRMKNSRDDSKMYNILHAVFPRSDAEDQERGLTARAPESLLMMDAPWCSVWKELPGAVGEHREQDQNIGADTKKVLGVGGYRYFPYAYWRWDVTNQYPYAIGPTLAILPQIYQANFLSMLLTKSADLHVRPPYQIPSSIERVNLRPGGFSYLTNPQERIEAIWRAGGEYPIGVDREERTAKSIRGRYGADYFLLMTGRLEQETNIRTATQAMQMESEQAAVLNSMMGRQADDFTSPMLAWLYYEEKEKGTMPERPPALDDVVGTPDAVLRPTYISPLALSLRRMSEVVTPMRAFEFLLPALQAFPPAIDALDITGGIRDMALASGWPVKRVRTEDEIQTMQRAAAQRAEKTQELESSEQLAKAIRNSGIDMNNSDQNEVAKQIAALMQASSPQAQGTAA